jgi:hypothetical protein
MSGNTYIDWYMEKRKLQQEIEKQRKEICDKTDEIQKLQNEITDMCHDVFELQAGVKELESSNAELLDVLEDFVIDVEGYFGFSETDDMEPEDDVAYFIGEYCRAKHLIKKEKGTDQ